MTHVMDEIYRSPNGDCWWLVSDTDTGRTFVRHEGNLSSGGHVTETGVAEFLRQSVSSPEYAALRRLIDRPGRDH
jgi:hypothetical protein